MAMGQLSMRTLLRVPDSGDFDLGSIDPGSTPGLPKSKAVRKSPKAWSRETLAELGVRLGQQQEMLYASGKVSDDRRRVLVVLQAMDGGGKDGTVGHVMGLFNPQGLRIHAGG